ncbi:MAG TPA: hypothetical protein VNQ76_21525 [Planctomicrobium sp.]|nr:hypothetical protein [Planctomicrobium sp.]
MTFIYSGENGTTSSGSTDANGHYFLKYTFRKAGAMVGHHDVKIEIEGAAAVRENQGKKSETGNNGIPDKYREPGTLTAHVKTGRQKINFDLSSSP